MHFNGAQLFIKPGERGERYRQGDRGQRQAGYNNNNNNKNQQNISGGFIKF